MARILFLVGLLAVANFVYGQSSKGSVRGKITTQDGSPAASVNAVLKGTNKGAVANLNGAFEIKNIVPGDYVLVVSFVGLESREINIRVNPNETTEVPGIFLKEDLFRLNEVIVSARSRQTYLQNEPSEQLRLQTSLLETPQSLIIVGEKVMRDQQAFSVNDLARNVSGVNSVFSYSNLYADFNIRGGGQGTGNNRLRNGIKPNVYAMMEDVSNIERIEFVKGPAGFMMNYGDPGGIFNVVTKQPVYNRVASVSLTTGSFGLFRSTIDFGGRVGKENSKASYRLTGAAHYGGRHQEHHSFERYSLAPSIKYDIGQYTSITFQYNLNYSKSRGADGTIPGDSSGRVFVLPQTFGIADPNLPGFVNYDHLGSIRLLHQLNDRWKFNGTVAVSDARWLGYELNTRSIPDAQNLLSRRLVYTDYQGRNYISQFFVNGTEKTGAIVHKILAGIDLGLQRTKYPAYNRLGSPYLDIDILNPFYGLNPDSLKAVSKAEVPDRDEQQWESVYLQDHITLNKWLQVSLAGRYSEFKNFASYNGPEEQTQRFRIFTPRIGITVLPASGLSFYALYDKSFVPQSGRVFNGGRLKPLVGYILEAGIKKEWFNNKLMTTLAFYDISRNNIVNPDPQNQNYVIQTGQAKTTGVELDIIGRINPHLSLIANYAYTNGRVTEDLDKSLIGVLPYGVVKHLANCWIKYQFTSFGLSGFGVALGGTYDSGRGGGTFSSDGNHTKLTPSYTRLDAGIYYDQDKFSLALNIDNLANEKYMTGGYWDAAWFYKPGAPASGRFTVMVKL